jgi:hypothetical protein
MKPLVIFFTVLILGCKASGQISSKDSSKTITYLSQISYYWKLDSTGTNGFRLFAYEPLLKKENTKDITEELLFEKLGKPNRINKDNGGTVYSYYYFDGSSIPKEAGKTWETFSIIFRFYPNSKYVDLVGTEYYEIYRPDKSSSKRF